MDFDIGAPMEEETEFDGPVLSSFELLFLKLKTLAGGDNLEAVLNVWSCDCSVNKQASKIVSLCCNFEQDVFKTMMKPELLKMSEYYDSIVMAVIDYMQRYEHTNCPMEMSFNSDWGKGSFMWQELIDTALLVVGNCNRADDKLTSEKRRKILTDAIIDIFPQTLIAVRLRNRLRQYVRNVCCKILNDNNSYNNVPLPKCC